MFGCHERRAGLVLDLLDPADGGAAGGIPVRERAPLSCHTLGVLRVAAEHAHFQAVALGVAGDIRRRADALLARRHEIVHMDAEPRQLAPHERHGRHAGSRAEHQAHQRTCEDAEGHRTEDF